MKKNKLLLGLILLATFPTLCPAQTTKSRPVRETTPRMREFNFAEWAQPTLELDTLYLLKNDTMSRYLAYLWEKDKSTPEEQKPVICMVSRSEMEGIKKRIYGKVKQTAN